MEKEAKNQIDKLISHKISVLISDIVLEKSFFKSIFSFIGNISYEVFPLLYKDFSNFTSLNSFLNEEIFPYSLREAYQLIPAYDFMRNIVINLQKKEHLKSFPKVETMSISEWKDYLTNKPDTKSVILDCIIDYFSNSRVYDSEILSIEKSENLNTFLISQFSNFFSLELNNTSLFRKFLYGKENVIEGILQACIDDCFDYFYLMEKCDFHEVYFWYGKEIVTNKVTGQEIEIKYSISRDHDFVSTNQFADYFTENERDIFSDDYSEVVKGVIEYFADVYIGQVQMDGEEDFKNHNLPYDEKGLLEVLCNPTESIDLFQSNYVQENVISSIEEMNQYSGMPSELTLTIEAPAFILSSDKTKKCFALGNYDYYEGDNIFFGFGLPNEHEVESVIFETFPLVNEVIGVMKTIWEDASLLPALIN